IGPAPIPNGQVTGGSTSTPVSGRVTAIAVHPTNPNTIYLGTAQGGLWRSLDGGVSWAPLMDTAQSLAIGAVTIDPLDPTKVFVGNILAHAGISGKLICCGTNPPSALFGLLFSSNALSASPSFSKVSGLPGGDLVAVTDMVFEPGSSNNLIVGLADLTVNSTDAGISGIYRSTNAWTASPT